jgi:hypothetical protein
MNLFPKLIILLIITILVIVFIRTIIYNNYITKINNSHANIDIEHFSQEKKALKLNSNFEDKLDNAIIYTTILGDIFIITSDIVYIIKDGKTIEILTSEFLNLDKNLEIDIKGGFFNHLNGIVYIFDNDWAYLFCLKSNKIINKIKKTNLFNIPIKEEIQHVIIFFNVFVIYTKKEIYFCDIITEKEIDNSREEELRKLFKKLPEGITNCFNNFLHIIYGIPIATPTFLKNGDIYYIDLNKNEINGPRRIENGFISNTESKMFNNSVSKINLINSDKFRIYIFGAGLENAGLGGMVFNDFVIDSKKTISFMSGKSGKRIPVRSDTPKDKLSEVYSHTLPFNGSCSGSGCSIFILDDKTEMVAGGGGGWSSEQVKAPSLCNSAKYILADNGTKCAESKIILPLKKIIILSETNNKNDRCRLLIDELNIEIFNQDDIKLDIQESPSPSLNKEKLYETDYSENGKSAQIEIIFNKSISDYKIKLNYLVESTSNKEFVNSKVIFIDEQYRKSVIQNFNYTFNFKYITGDTITRFIKTISPKRDVVHIDEQPFITNGLDCFGQVKNITKYEKELINYDINPKEGENRYMLLEGGFGGGGHSLVDRFSKNIVASGGGGYIGGKTSAIDAKYDIEYAAGSGGTSYINDITYKGKWLDGCEDLFCNAINNSDGYMILQSINESPKHNVYKKSTSKKNNKKGNSANNNSNNNVFNKNVERFFNFEKPKFASLIDYIDYFDFSEGNLMSSDKIHIIKKDVKNLKNNLNHLFYAVRANKPFSLILIGWDAKNYKRMLINYSDNKQTYIKNDISQLNHGYETLSNENMETYLDKLIISDEWTSKNSTISSKEKYVNFSKQSNNFNYIDGFISLNLEKFDRVILMLKFDENKTNKNIKYVFNQFNKEKQSENEIRESTIHYLDNNSI